MDIKYLISLFEEEYTHTYEQEEKLRKTFIEKFPIEELKNLELERYALGKQLDNLCWWLEFNTIPLGSIRGGNAKKFKIYFGKKDQKWIYPDKQFTSVEQAWQELRSSIYNFVTKFEKKDYEELKDESLISSMNMFKTKLLYMYFPDKLLPVYSLEHIYKILVFFKYKYEEIKNWDIIKANIELKKFQDNSEEFKSWDGLKFMRFLYTVVLYESKIYKIAPGEQAKYWNECFEEGYICLGWDKVGDLRNFNDYSDFKETFIKEYSDEYNNNKSKLTEKANEVWKFFNLETGNKILANRGTSSITGVGTVLDKGYDFDQSREEFKHIVYVDWDKDFNEKKIEPQKGWAFKTVADVSKKLYEQVYGNEDKITKAIAKEKETKNNVNISSRDVVFTEEEEKFFNDFNKIIARKGNVILYGPPGTGKTYLSSRYLKWISKSDKVESEMCTFHPSFNYEDFIEGYKPDSNGSNVVFKLRDGIFKSICERAIKHPDTNYYLIIDEINRGNVEKIFGEMITLIEKDKRGLKLRLSQSKEEFYVPQNIFIIGTMNTTDKSVKMLDAALRRRFSFKECMPNYDLIDNAIEEIGISPGKILSDINRSLREIEDREKQIGHSYFMNQSKQIDSIEELKQVYIYDIIPLISEYCYNDYVNMSKIIGEKFIDKDSQELKEELIYGTNDFFAAEIVNQFGENND